MFPVFISFFASLFVSDFKIPLRYDIHGIDVSHHQSVIDWTKVSEEGHARFKVSFCFIKATEGGTFNDTKFDQNWDGCKEVGIKRGAYHFFTPNVSPKTQALNYINSVRLYEGDLAPVLDFEMESATLSVAKMRAYVAAYLKYIERHYHIKPIIYTNTHMYQKYIRGGFKNYTLWIADYDSNNIFERLWHPKLKFWQYSEHGKIKGIRGNVDCNAFLGQAEDLEELSI